LEEKKGRQRQKKFLFLRTPRSRNTENFVSKFFDFYFMFCYISEKSFQNVRNTPAAHLLRITCWYEEALTRKSPLCYTRHWIGLHSRAQPIAAEENRINCLVWLTASDRWTYWIANSHALWRFRTENWIVESLWK